MKKQKVYNVVCPICGSPMVLRETLKFRYKDGQPRKFYSCSRWPNCNGTHGAHPNGAPLGIPADEETKQYRMKAHSSFDPLWEKGVFVSRKKAYNWLSFVMKTGHPVHISELNKAQCLDLIKICDEKMKEYKNDEP